MLGSSLTEGTYGCTQCVIPGLFLHAGERQVRCIVNRLKRLACSRPILCLTSEAGGSGRTISVEQTKHGGDYGTRYYQDPGINKPPLIKGLPDCIAIYLTVHVPIKR